MKGRHVKQLAQQGAQIIAARENSAQAQHFYPFADLQDKAVMHGQTMVGFLTTDVKAFIQSQRSTSRHKCTQIVSVLSFLIGN